MVSINSRHVWILIVLVLAFLAPTKSRGIAYITYDVNNNPQNVYFTNGSITGTGIRKEKGTGFEPVPLIVSSFLGISTEKVWICVIYLLSLQANKMK